MFLVLLHSILFSSMHLLEKLFEELIQCNATVYLTLALVMALVKAPLTPEYKPYRRAKRLLVGAYLFFSANLFAWCFLTKGEWDVYDYYIECADVILFYLEDIFICYALFSLLNKRYATRRRMIIDAGLWLLTCALSLSAVQPAMLPYRDILRLLALTLYIAFIVRFVYTYIRQYQASVRRLDNYYSNNMHGMIQWTGTSVILMAVSWFLAIMTLFQGIYFNLLVQVYIIGLYIYIAVSFLNFSRQFIEVQKAIEEETETVEVPTDLEKRLQAWVKEKAFLTQQFSIDDLATTLGTNTNYLSCLINEKYRYNFSAWISSLRIAEAKRLMLESPELKMENIAYSVGFSSASYFSKVFSLQEGISPAVWRKKNL